MRREKNIFGLRVGISSDQGWSLRCVSSCKSGVCRKTLQVPAVELAPFQTSRPMQLVCIDFLKLEKSKGGYEDVLVITDHFTRYAQAIQTRNQTAVVTAKVLFENFVLHYGIFTVHTER